MLEEIFNQNEVSDEFGNKYTLHSNTSKEQCSFIDKIIKGINDPKVSLEIGLAYGVSTLQIINSLYQTNKNFKHLIIDPFQKNDWKNIGLFNIHKSGLSNHITFYEEHSDIVLPRLYSSDIRIDFAYVDSTKNFDVLMVDLYYILRIMNKGAIIILDDCDFPGIRLLVRFLSQHPCLRFFEGFNKDKHSLKGKFAAMITYWFLKRTPFRSRYASRIDISTDEELRVNYKCIAFQKIADDNRAWNWHTSF